MDINELDEFWSQATVEERNFDNLPDGKYQARVESCRLTETKESQTPMIAWEFVALSPLQHEGRHIFHNRVLRDLESAKWAKQDFYNLGVKADSIKELMDKLEEVLDCVVEIQLKTKGEYQNVYLNKNLGKPALGHEVQNDGFNPWA